MQNGPARGEVPKAVGKILSASTLMETDEVFKSGISTFEAPFKDPNDDFDVPGIGSEIIYLTPGNLLKLKENLTDF